MRELTREQAQALFESKFWKTLNARERTAFQLFTDLLCMPFDVFHKSTEEALRRPVYTHEFAFPELLRAEFLGDEPAPTLQEILDLIPSDKKVMIVWPGSE